MTQRLKVLFIGGSGRNGSTLLASVLGQIQGFCSVGELRYIWDRGLVENRYCGCGKRFLECEFWSAVLDSGVGERGTLDGQDLARRREAGLRSRHLLLPGLAARKMTDPVYQPYLDATRQLYPAIRQVSGCDVIVDASKFPSYQHVLESFPDLDVYTVHLVRDPRAVTYSYCYRRKSRSPFERDQLLESRRPLTTALSWHEWNVLLRRSGRRNPARYMALRYEDFARAPLVALRQVVAFIGEEPEGLPFIGDRQVVLAPQHTVSGNPDRFRTGAATIQDEEEWKSRLGRGMRYLVSATTWPERVRYGYRERLA